LTSFQFLLHLTGGKEILLDTEETFFEETTLDKIESSTEKIFDKLNPEQAKAVKCLEGPLLIMAGAGSGKTRVLTCRMANLLAHGVPAWNILAITFTNKAAREMKTRAENMIGEIAQNVWISTFHSFCARVLRREIEVTGKYRSNFVIYDAHDSQVLIKNCVTELGLAADRFANVSNTISAAKNNLMDAAQFSEYISKKIDSSDYDRYVAAIYQKYEKKLIANNALDFDDLILVMVNIFRDYEDIREKYQDKYRYILVDEYQDTNTAQYMLTKYLAAKYQNICVVGDADQSIYGWRGADMRNILNFENDYPNTTTIVLEQNYRSTQQILNAANAVIQKNINRKEKNLWTENPEGDKVKFIHCMSDKSEAAFVSKTIQRLVTKENYSYDDIAILYRTNAQSRILEERFIQSEIPYVIIGGLKFYDRKEVKDILAYLRLIYNPRDNVSLQRIVNVPKRGIGNTNINKLADFANLNGMSLFEVIANSKILDEAASLTSRAKHGLHDFVAMIMSFVESHKNMTVAKLVQAVIDETGYIEALKKNSNDKIETTSRIENLSAFVNSAEEFTENNQNATLEDFLNHIALIADADAKEIKSDPRVPMMTIHSAKGLEFPIVFVTGMEEGLLPHANSSLEQALVEEERRTCYVAMTRAKKDLYLTAACERKTFGKIYPSSLSRFIKEIPSEYLKILSEKSNLDSGRQRMSQAMIGIAPQNYPHRKVYAAPTANRDAKVVTLSDKPKVHIDWKVGDQVQHRKWGIGTVMEVDQDLLKIVFSNPEIGEKNLRASKAPIEKI